MAFYVYILKSKKDNSYYKGYTEDYIRRFNDHNDGLSNYTSLKCPWELIYVEILPSKKDALIRERKLKKCKSDYFEWLSNQPTNILKI